MNTEAGIRPNGGQQHAGPAGEKNGSVDVQSSSVSGSTSAAGQARPESAGQFFDLAAIGLGSEVVSVDLQTVGYVQDLLFDERSGDLRAVRVAAGFVSSRPRDVGAALISGVADGIVYLSVSWAHAELA